MRTTIFGLIAGLTMLLSATPISAHHAFSAEFDADRPMQLHGTVTKTEGSIHTHGFISMFKTMLVMWKAGPSNAVLQMHSSEEV